VGKCRAFEMGFLRHRRTKARLGDRASRRSVSRVLGGSSLLTGRAAPPSALSGRFAGPVEIQEPQSQGRTTVKSGQKQPEKPILFQFSASRAPTDSPEEANCFCLQVQRANSKRVRSSGSFFRTNAKVFSLKPISGQTLPSSTVSDLTFLDVLWW